MFHYHLTLLLHHRLRHLCCGCFFPTAATLRYDENITFVKRELLPWVEAVRDAKAAALGARWAKHLRLTVSFAAGSPARISAIQAALRPYKPQYLHMWQKKTFWEETKVTPLVGGGDRGRGSCLVQVKKAGYG